MNKKLLTLISCMMLSLPLLLTAQSNDSCINAISIPVGQYCDPDTFSSAGATAEPASIAPNPSCGFYSGGDVWFTVVVPASGALRYEVHGISGINPQTAIYTGTCGAMTQLLCLQLHYVKTIVNASLAGQTLYIRIFNYSNASGGTFSLCCWEPTVPLNNDCADAFPVTVDTACIPGSYTNAYSTPEPSSVAPNPSCGFYAGSDVWFSSTMPESGVLRIETTGNHAQSAIYHGTCGSFTQIICNQLNPDRTIIDTSLAGEPIYVRVFSYSSDDGAPFTLCLWEPPVPPNNNCDQAIPIPVGNSCQPLSFTNAYATAQGTDIAPNPSCGFYAGGDVWFSSTMPESGALRIETTGSQAQSAIYTGSCGSFTQVVCNQLNPEKTIVDTAIAGEPIYIRIFSYSNEEGAPFSLCLWEPPIPPNDRCDQAIPLTVGSHCLPQQFTNAYATTEGTATAPNPSCGFYGGGDVWFTALMPPTGKMILHRDNISGVNAQWAVYSGSCGNFTQVACAQLTSNMVINNLALAGQTLYIRVFNYSNEEGGVFTFCVYDTTCNNNVDILDVYDTICSGESFLFPDGTLVYDITESMIDSSYFYNSLFCDSLIITHLQVTPLLPAPDLPAQAVLACDNNGLLLDAGPGFESYHWNTGENTNTISVTFPGTYIVSVSGCTSGPVTDTCVVSITGPAVNGKALYDNNAHSPLCCSRIYLKDAGGGLLDSTDTDTHGNYRFCDLSPGNYYLTTRTTLPWGGINSIDGLLVLQHFAEQIILTGLRLQAADVNLSGSVNSIDGLLIVRRFVDLINSFAVGDWIFESPQFTITGDEALTVDVRGLCTGDLNGSYSP
ncbi:MAG: dockerin type I domain-containing protein [Bacteroidales bacterium]